ncbi:hypothetical protein [Amycolatopsis lexingtonensis]|uniref:hypothetical protein n=1 Tax=Amycolatopsis lexingtonensis TaxID=218822 RepID=UPI003F72B9A3
MAVELDQLRADAASREYGPMARLARALYETGSAPEQVLRECYGVGFPREVFVIAGAGPYTLHLMVSWTSQPWQLAIPLDRGGPAAEPGAYDPMEERFRELDPDLLPLLFLYNTGDDEEDPGVVLCYRLTELAAGRPTIFAAPEGSADAVQRGGSLLAVLHEHHADYLRELEAGDEDSQNRGEYDLVAPEELREVRALVRRIETLQREASA